MRKKHMIMLIFAVIFFFTGFSALTYELDLTDGFAVVSGQLVFERAADPDVDLIVPFAYPLLTRTVEMAQYIKRGSVVSLELSTRDPEVRIEGTSGDKRTVFENPRFPKWIRRHAYLGDISITSGDQKLRLHESLVSKLYLSDHEYLDSKTERYVVARKLVKDEDAWRNSELIDRFVETDDLAVGDIVITWRSIKRSSLAPVYTVYGRVHDGVIGDDEHDVIICDREMTIEELAEVHFTDTGTRMLGKVMLLLSVILVVLALLPKFRSKKA